MHPQVGGRCDPVRRRAQARVRGAGEGLQSAVHCGRRRPELDARGAVDAQHSRQDRVLRRGGQGRVRQDHERPSLHGRCVQEFMKSSIPCASLLSDSFFES